MPSEALEACVQDCGPSTNAKLFGSPVPRKSRCSWLAKATRFLTRRLQAVEPDKKRAREALLPAVPFRKWTSPKSIAVESVKKGEPFIRSQRNRCKTASRFGRVDAGCMAKVLVAQTVIFGESSYQDCRGILGGNACRPGRIQTRSNLQCARQ